MTRVTPLPRELAKLTKTVGSSITAAAPRSSQSFKNASWSTASRARKELEHGGADVPASERTITTSHRPASQPAPSASRTIPLMQSFFSTTPHTPARADVSTIDYAFLPKLHITADPSTDYVGRVPLLPDNYAPSRAPSLFAPEVADEPLAAPVVVAADPENISAVSALTEVEGMSPDGIELSFVHEGPQGGLSADGGPGDSEEGYAGGMLNLWKGLVDDTFGGHKVKPAM